MVQIHEKIVAQLEQRKLKKRDLARALGVSPQTATDICKGRSAITLPHLRNLVAFFELRADFWIDDQKLMPDTGDRVQSGGPQNDSIARSTLSQIPNLDRFLQRLRALATEHQREFLVRNSDMTPEERRVLGFAEATTGSVGRVSEALGG